MSFYSEFASYYEEVFPFRDEVYAFLRQYAGAPSGRVLDIGCGPGHYCGRFVQDGFMSIGIDLDSQMIASAVQKYPEASFRSMDMSDIGIIQEKFRMVFSIGNVLAHLPRPALKTFVHDVFSLLEPGGFWVFQVINWDSLLLLKEYTFPLKVLHDGQLIFHRHYSSVSEDSVRFSSLLKSGDETVFNADVMLFPVRYEAYCAIHEEAGFTRENCYSDFRKASFWNKSGSSLVFVFHTTGSDQS